MIKNSNKMYKVLGLIIAVARASCLPLAATTVSVPLTNNTGLSLYYTVTQSGSSSPTYNNVLLTSQASVNLQLNSNAKYTITVNGGSLGTVLFQFSTTDLAQLILWRTTNSFQITETLIGPSGAGGYSGGTIVGP